MRWEGVGVEPEAVVEAEGVLTRVVPGSHTPLEEPGGVASRPAEEEERPRSLFVAVNVRCNNDGLVLSSGRSG